MSRSGSQHYVGRMKEPVENNGKYIIKAPELSIIWGNDKRFWRIPDEGAVDEGVELKQVGYLEVKGSIDLEKLNPGKYKLSFLVSKKPEAFGLSSVSMAANKGEIQRNQWKRIDLSHVREEKTAISVGDETIEIEAGPRPGKLCFGLSDFRRRWKGGLVIYEAWLERLS